MFIKIIKKNDKRFYILCVCDAKTKVWSERFIEEKIALTMISECNIKFKEL